MTHEPSRPNDSAAPATHPFYIQATAPPDTEGTRVLKQGETFAVFDRYGDVKPRANSKEGVFHEGTRFLSCWLLRLGEGRPMYLSSTVRQDNDVLTVDLTNLDLAEDGRVRIPRGTLHLARTKFVWHGVCYEQFHLVNYSAQTIQLPIFLHFEADFADIFEVRGTQRARRGRFLPPALQDGTVVLGYEGLDGVVRRARLEF